MARTRCGLMSMRSKAEIKTTRRRIVSIVVVWAWIIGSIVILVRVERDGSLLFFVPFSMAPLLGMLWVWNWATELPMTYRHNYRFSVGFVFILTPMGYLILSVLFAAGYLAATKLGGQVVSDNGECIKDFGSLLYFSIVTGSTVGYGDLSPTGVTRILACFHVMEFWMFLGVALLYLQNSVQRELPE